MNYFFIEKLDHRKLMMGRQLEQSLMVMGMLSGGTPALRILWR
jgi:hypothetical protein